MKKKKLSISINNKDLLKNIMNDLTKLGLPKESVKNETKSYFFKEKNIKFENIHYKTYNDKLFLEGFTKIYKLDKSFNPTFP